MKGIICYYSGSGNTRLACRYIAERIKNAEFDLYDIIREKSAAPDLAQFDIVGFATFTDFFGPPHLLHTFVDGLPRQHGKPAFILNTYGNVTGRTIKAMQRLVTSRGFRVVAGHSLYTPESYPPMVASGRGHEHRPDERDMEEFTDFIGYVDQSLADLRRGKPVKTSIRIRLLDRFCPVLPRDWSRRFMGDKFVDQELCIQCGVCERKCPYGAIALEPKPVFDMEECMGCWACYNHCAQKAIYTAKLRGVGHYPKPAPQLKKKLGA